MSTSSLTFTALLCAVTLLALACERPDTPLVQNGSTSPDSGGMITPDLGRPDQGADMKQPVTQVEDELGHGEDKEPGTISEQGTFHGWWAAVVTDVNTPPVDPNSTEFEQDYEAVIGQPFLSAEVIHSVGASEGAGGFVMGGASGLAGMSDSFSAVGFSGDVMTLSWFIGEGKKPFTLTTTKRIDETHFEGTIRSEFDVEGLLYIVKLEKLPDTELEIDPDPEDQPPAPIEGE